MKYTILIILFHLGLLVFAQEIPFREIDASRPISQYTIKEWNMNNGLPNNAIMDIEKTSEGFMWLATFNGLTRFDGLEFIVYNRSNTPQLKTNTISALIVDQQDNLWIGTNGGGLVKHNNGHFQWFDTDSIDGSVITALAEGENNRIWIGTRSGLATLHDNMLVKSNDSHLKNASITALFHDYKDRLWVGTADQGLFIVDENGAMNLGQRHGLQSNFIRTIYVDSKDNVWVGTDRGVAIINGEGVHKMDSVKGAPLTFTNRFMEDVEGNVWIASNDGLRRYNQSFEKVNQDAEVGHHIVQSLYQDEEQNIWAGTYRQGLGRLNQSKFLLIGENEGLINEIMNVTYKDDSIYWAGTDNGLICLKNGTIQTFSLGRNSAGNRIRDIYRDSKQRLWICTYNGLNQF